MLAFWTLSRLYLRYSVIIIVALSTFMVGFDLLENAGDLPPSANLVLLYIMYKLFFAFDMMLPISLVFAMIASLVELIRTNTLTAYYALGYSKLQMLMPFVSMGSLLILIHIGLHSTGFARANEYATNLRETSQFLRPTSNLFFTHRGNYIYFGNLYPLTKQAEEIRIFRLENGTLKEAIRAEKAWYQNGHWQLENAKILHPPGPQAKQDKGIEFEDVKRMQVLPDFKPKILDQVYEGRASFTIGDALEALQLFRNQNIDVDKITGALYRIFVTPWFALILMIAIFWYAPINPRYMNLSLFSFTAILSTLMIWGIIFMLSELAMTKTLSPEVGIILPVFALFGALSWQIGTPLRRVRVKSR